MSSSALYPLPKFSPVQKPGPVSLLPSLTLFSGRQSPVVFPHRPVPADQCVSPFSLGTLQGTPDYQAASLWMDTSWAALIFGMGDPGSLEACTEIGC